MSAPLLPYEQELRRPGERAKELLKRLIAVTARPLGTLVRVATTEPAIALTFDDGPDPEETPRVLDLLAGYDAHATFFMVGRRAEAHPQLVARVIAAGHAIANHSWDHASFVRLDSRGRRERLRRTADALGPNNVPLFRPPFGEQNVASLLDARRAGYRIVGWDVAAEDWRDHPAEHLVARTMRRLRRGSIVVFHDSLYVTEDSRYRDRAPMRQALATLLASLTPTHRFVTVPELLRIGRPVYWHHYHRLPGAFHQKLI
ncbi:MAG TPA: polysaccharide deacetylase family protein [Thermoanaerobaculia bacterium]|nr:polysaccharide deacetylase family protein [Thermoanaerobaculia bacterium]